MEDNSLIGPSLSTPNENVANYFRLVQLTMVEGTKIVRKTILNHLPQRKTLQLILSDRRQEFVQRNSGFNRQQLDILYPPSEHADLAKIDMTLWFALARKLYAYPKTCLADPPTGENENTSITAPLLGTQVGWYQDLETIRAVKYSLFHRAKPEMETATFDEQWNRLTETLYRLDPDLEPSVIERYRTAELKQKDANRFRAMVREQFLDERCEDLVEDVQKKKRVIRLILVVVSLVFLVILVGILLYCAIFRQLRTCDQSLEYRVIGDLGGLKFMPRSGWGAEKPRVALEQLHLPVPYIVYTHTAELSRCGVTYECCDKVKHIQYLQMNERTDKFPDIGYHYLVDSKGIVYEGRDITKIPSAVHGWNRNITSVAFIGNFVYQTPTVESLAAFDLLIAYLINNNYIVRNYTIYGMCECRNTESPGRILYEAINDSKLVHLLGHVRHRPDNHCFRNESMAEDQTTRATRISTSQFMQLKTLWKTKDSRKLDDINEEKTDQSTDYLNALRQKTV